MTCNYYGSAQRSLAERIRLRHEIVVAVVTQEVGTELPVRLRESRDVP